MIPIPTYKYNSHVVAFKVRENCTKIEVELESDSELTEDSNDWEETSAGVQTVEKAFQCKLCDKSFIRSYYLKIHQPTTFPV